MLALLANVILAAILAILQVSFLSRLPSPWAELPVITAAAAFLIATDRPLAAAGWLVLGGLIFDLHGPYGFGTELALAWLSFAVMRLIFARLLANASSTAIFLLAMAGAGTRFLGLACIDGVRVLFGRQPYLLVLEPAIAIKPALAMLMAGTAAVATVLASNWIQRVAARLFLQSRLKLKL